MCRCATAACRPSERKLRIEDALGLVGLGSRMKHFPAELSGGQQQRVAIARALAGSPRLLLADEPTGNLDSQMARGVMELLEDINQQGTTIIMVTHDPELAARAQRNVHIVDGDGHRSFGGTRTAPRRASGQRFRQHIRVRGTPCSATACSATTSTWPCAASGATRC